MHELITTPDKAAKPADESPLSREIQLLLSGVESLPKVAKEAMINHPGATLGKFAIGAGIGIAMAELAPAEGILGTLAQTSSAGMGLSFVFDIGRNCNNISSALIDNWRSGANWDRNVATMENSIGKFGFDSLLMTAGGALGISAHDAFINPTLSIYDSPTIFRPSKSDLDPQFLFRQAVLFKSKAGQSSQTISDMLKQPLQATTMHTTTEGAAPVSVKLASEIIACPAPHDSSHNQLPIGTRADANELKALYKSVIDQGDFEAAKQYAKQDLDLAQQSGEDGVDLAKKLEVLSKILFMQGDLNGAEQGLSKAATLRREHLTGIIDDNYSDLAFCLSLQLKCLLSLGNNEAAEPVVSELIHLYEPWPAQSLGLMKQQSKILHQLGKSAEARRTDAAISGIEAPLPDLSSFKEPLPVFPAYPPRSITAESQSREAAYNFLFKGQLEDGFSLASSFPIRRTFLMVSPSRDPVLEKTLQATESNFGHLRSEPDQLATALSHYTDRILTPQDENRMVKEYCNVIATHPDKTLLLGKFIQDHSGVCTPRALLLKAMGDRLGIDLTLREGYAKLPNGRTENHVFTTLDIGSQRKVYDPGLRIYGKELHHAEYASPFFNELWDDETTPVN